jgi:hypothetical protein
MKILESKDLTTELKYSLEGFNSRLELAKELINIDQ